MSTNLNYKQVTNVKRRTWDREAYEKRAKAREANADNDDDKTTAPNPSKADDKEEFMPAAKGAAGPERSERAFLQARKNRVSDIDSKIGTTELVSAEGAAVQITDGVTKTGVGWYCKVCDCFLKDSHSYLDHINGRKHQKKLGYSMRVERSTKDQLASRLTELAKETKQEKQEPVDFDQVVKSKDEEAQRRKEERARKRKERKQRAQEKEEESEEEEEEEFEEEETHPDMAAMMGFAGFGGGNKNG